VAVVHAVVLRDDVARRGAGHEAPSKAIEYGMGLAATKHLATHHVRFRILYFLRAHSPPLDVRWSQKRSCSGRGMRL